MTSGGPDLGPLPTLNAPAYGRPRNGVGIAALIVGILGLLLSVTVFLGIPLGILAVVLGLAGRGRAKRGEATNGGFALAGTILGVVAVLVGVAIVTAVFDVSSEQSKLYKECRDRATSDADRAACKQRFEPGS
jgi:hypothetical protein